MLSWIPLEILTEKEHPPPPLLRPVPGVQKPAADQETFTFKRVIDVRESFGQSAAWLPLCKVKCFGLLYHSFWGIFVFFFNNVWALLSKKFTPLRRKMFWALFHSFWSFGASLFTFSIMLGLFCLKKVWELIFSYFYDDASG